MEDDRRCATCAHWERLGERHGWCRRSVGQMFGGNEPAWAVASNGAEARLETTDDHGCRAWLAPAPP